MKRNIIYILFATLLVACSSDDILEQDNNSGFATVNITLGTSNLKATRAWVDPNAETDRSEMMYNWYVYIVDGANKIVDIFTKASVADDKAEIDAVKTEYTIPTGTYKFYSFANFLPSALAGKSVGDVMPDVSSLKCTVNGNGFIPSSTNPVPMSNVQQITITALTTDVNLIVVRMLAKIQFQLKLADDATSTTVKVNKITISDITANTSDNIYVLPNYNTPSTAHSMESGDLLTNIATASKVSYTHTLATPLTLTKTAQNVTFYLNESKLADITKYFKVTLNTERDGVTSDESYGYLKDHTSGSDDAWSFFARNDFIKIPVTLNDYILDITPVDFPPIGGYPAAIKGSGEDFEVTFYVGGHFHMIPKVYKNKKDAGTLLTYGTSAGNWEIDLAHTDYATSLLLKNASSNDALYYTDPYSLVDGADNGGLPIWDNTNKFVFGKLKPFLSDQTDYRLLPIKIYDSSSAIQRLMTYRIKIVLDFPY